jgi:hypothetical protein
MQTPAWQLSVDLQGLLHLPQFCGSVFVSTQVLLQKVCPDLHGEAQTLFWHAPLAQTLPHLPQFCGSEVVSMHWPPQTVLVQLQEPVWQT